MSEAYQQAWQASIADREGFWSKAAEAIDWIAPPQRAWDENQGWFAGGTLNTDFATARRLFTLICVLHIRG